MRSNGPISPGSSDLGAKAPVRLDSWKQIANYFDRDVRTVRRWEAERTLPVRRLPGGERSGVFAYVHELEQWRHGSSAADEETVDPADPVDSAALGESSATEAATSTLSAPAVANPAVVTPRRGRFLPFSETLHLKAVYLSAALLVLIALGGSALAHRHALPQAVAQSHIPSPPSRELYLQGRYLWSLRTEASLTRAVDLFTQSIALDPKYAPAYAGLADSFLLLREYGHMPDAQAFPRALAAARQAVVLDESAPDGHRSLAFVLNYWSWDFPAANREFQRALELDPRDAQTHHWFASALWSQGQVAGAREQIDMARALDPQSITILSERALFFESLDKPAALATWRQLEQTNPDFPLPHNYLGDRGLTRGDAATFLQERRTLAQLRKSSGEVELLNASERALHEHGFQSMLGVLYSHFSKLADRGETSGFEAAHYAMLAGDQAGAMRYLQLSYQQHEPSFLICQIDDTFDPLRSTAAFRALVARRTPTAGVMGSTL